LKGKRKEGKKEERKEGRKEGRKEARKEGRKEKDGVGSIPKPNKIFQTSYKQHNRVEPKKIRNKLIIRK